MSGPARRMAAGLLAGLLLGALGWGAQPSSRLFPKAVPELAGLRLRVTLPQSHYGPGEPIQVYCTLSNTGAKGIPLPADLTFTAVMTEAGEERVFPQGPCDPPRTPAPMPPSLAPGQRLVRCLSVRPGRRDLLPGEFPFRVYLVLSGEGGPKGTLASEAVLLRIRYNVFWVS